jgi:Flp pilus assembly pilin Flp
VLKLRQFLKDENGVEIVEWAIIVGLIALVSLGVLMGISSWVANVFQTLSTMITS